MIITLIRLQVVETEILFYDIMYVFSKLFWNLRFTAIHRSKCTVVQHPKSTSSTVQAQSVLHDDVTDIAVKEYTEIPGPKSLPLLGNNWRFMSYVGESTVTSRLT